MGTEAGFISIFGVASFDDIFDAFAVISGGLGELVLSFFAVDGWPAGFLAVGEDLVVDLLALHRIFGGEIDMFISWGDDVIY